MVAGYAAGQRDHGADDARGRAAGRCSGFAVRRLTFDLWRPAGLRAFGLETDMLRDGRKAKTMQVRLMDGDVEIGRCTALLTAQGGGLPPIPFRSKRR